MKQRNLIIKKVMSVLFLIIIMGFLLTACNKSEEKKVQIPSQDSTNKDQNSELNNPININTTDSNDYADYEDDGTGYE